MTSAASAAHFLIGTRPASRGIKAKKARTMKKRYAGDQRHVIAGDRQHVADAGYKQRVVNVWRDRVAKRAGRGRHHGGPKRRLALRREVENDAGAIGNCEPWQEPPLVSSCAAHSRMRAGEPNCARHQWLPCVPCPLPGHGRGRGSGHGIEPAPGRARFSALCFAATASKPQRA